MSPSPTFFNKSLSTTVSLVCICGRRFKMDTIVNAEFFENFGEPFASTVKSYVLVYGTVHLQFKFSKIFEFDKCVGEFLFYLQDFD